MSLTEDQNSYINDVIDKILAAQHAAIERACRESVLGRKHGVKVLQSTTGLFVSVEVSEEVPYGEIHHHRTEPEPDLSEYISPRYLRRLL